MHLRLVPPLEDSQPSATFTVPPAADLGWVRRSLGWCELFARECSLTGTEQVLLIFAIEWAPYGGADAETVFVKFGVSRLKFLHMVQAALMPRSTEPRRFTAVKAALCQEILRAWQPVPRPTARPMT
ncbi:hypothetical protein RhoFasB10_00890 [Rhodococcus sp. B10]|uniref:DUF3263 domain-containing protein n=1 Tax=Rhodococcoides kyotonense TaxID=398843 RepID=A0A177YGY5_9NOCA|nr:hypothetical protein [Rhodococcus sp. B10]OAK54802.1 hypothetical protein A3K89_05635 [Rhodococcus kyotonensis]